MFILSTNRSLYQSFYVYINNIYYVRVWFAWATIFSIVTILDLKFSFLNLSFLPIVFELKHLRAAKYGHPKCESRKITMFWCRLICLLQLLCASLENGTLFFCACAQNNTIRDIIIA